jgi:hypothetical protein
MTRLRGVAPFAELWQRRTTLESDGESIELLALPDLVQAKKNQRDNDWPMIARLLEANYFANRANPTDAQIAFWLSELRTPAVLVEVATRYPEACSALVPKRGLLAAAQRGEEASLREALKVEEENERAADRAYWLPLRAELEQLRHRVRKSAPLRWPATGKAPRDSRSTFPLLQLLDAQIAKTNFERLRSLAHGMNLQADETAGGDRIL